MKILSCLLLAAIPVALGYGVDDNAHLGESYTPKPTTKSLSGPTGYWCTHDNGPNDIAITDGGLEFLNPAYACTTGSSQTPIALMVADYTDAPVQTEPMFMWTKMNYTVEMTAHGPRSVHCRTGGPCLQKTMFEGKTLTLLQWHAHSPSEHTLNGKYYDAEIHFVHSDDATGALYVFGVFVDVQKKGFNSVFQALLDNAENVTPGNPSYNNSPANIQPKDLLPEPRGKRGNKRRPYLRYMGSLTTEPCTEGINWSVFVDPITITADQWRQYLHIVSRTDEIPTGFSFFQNNRALQPLNGRTVSKQMF